MNHRVTVSMIQIQLKDSCRVNDSMAMCMKMTDNMFMEVSYDVGWSSSLAERGS
jgi:hypothetical protein